jgi:AcrR family transcriptional regulator
MDSRRKAGMIRDPRLSSPHGSGAHLGVRPIDAGRPTVQRADGAPERGSAREAIVEAAIDSFYEHGYENTSVQDVVERARVTKGAFYHHFEKKDDLLLHIHDRFMDDLLGAIEALRARQLPPREALALLIEDIVVATATYQREYAIFFEQRRNLAAEPFQKVRAKRDQYERLVVETIQDGIAKGAFRAVPSAHVLAFGIIGMVAWAYHWYRPSGLSPREIGRMYASVVLDGITSP